MSSKRFKKLPEKTSDLPSEAVDKLIPILKQNCTTKFDESLDISLQINNKQKKNEINIRTVINLRGPREDLVDQMERRVCKNLNLSLIEFKLHSRGAPTIDQIFLSKKLFGEIEYPALIHCKSGADRTGLMASLYLINKGIDVDEAKKQLSFKYLHIRLAKSGILDHFFESFIEYRKKNNKISFWEWSKKYYNPKELKISFKINFVRVFFDSLMRRE